MKLSVHNRVVLLNLLPVLPEQGTELYILTVEDLKKKIQFTEKEKQMFEIKSHENGDVEWNPKTAKDKAMRLSTQEATVLKQLRTILDERGLISLKIMPVITLIKNL